MNDPIFWKLEALSDRQLLDGLDAVLGSGRRLVAELVAHLGEVEERRLHLAAACSSMFSYCVQRLGLSEDEACRRIEVARLARRCPAMFPLLAAGKLSLSVAALLKPHLSAESQRNPCDQLDLLAAVSGKSVQQAREVLAARFPRPDVPSSLRRLHNRRSGTPGDLDRVRVRSRAGSGRSDLDGDANGYHASGHPNFGHRTPARHAFGHRRSSHYDRCTRGEPQRLRVHRLPIERPLRLEHTPRLGQRSGYISAGSMARRQ